MGDLRSEPPAQDLLPDHPLATLVAVNLTLHQVIVGDGITPGADTKAGPTTIQGNRCRESGPLPHQLAKLMANHPHGELGILYPGQVRAGKKSVPVHRAVREGLIVRPLPHLLRRVDDVQYHHSPG